MGEGKLFKLFEWSFTNWLSTNSIMFFLCYISPIWSYIYWMLAFIFFILFKYSISIEFSLLFWISLFVFTSSSDRFWTFISYETYFGFVFYMFWLKNLEWQFLFLTIFPFFNFLYKLVFEFDLIRYSKSYFLVSILS